VNTYAKHRLVYDIWNFGWALYMCDMSRINVHAECRCTIGDVYSMVEV
jgi:hypothetical protein